MKRLILKSFLILAICPFPAAAQGIGIGLPPLDKTLSRTVDLSAFDVRTVEGISGVHRRIVSTSYQICSPLLSGVKADMQLYRKCILESVENAIWRANHADLASFHLALEPSKRARIWKKDPVDWQPGE